jgi:hypothetical protein
MKPSTPEPMAREMTATKGLWSADEMMNGSEMTGDMRCREVASAPKVRTATETTAPTEGASAAKMRGASKVWTTAAEMTATAEMTAAATAEMATTSTEMTTTATEMATTMRRGDRHRRTAQGKRRNDCQHCPAHTFLAVPGRYGQNAPRPERLH